MPQAISQPGTCPERVAGRWARRVGRPWLAVVAIALGALALRWWRLDAQSLWLDEGISVYFANLGPVRIWQIAFSIEPNPPLYNLLLWAWLTVFGQSEVAVRGLSALAGALCVFPAYVLTQAWGGRRAGLLAALITASSPYLLWYSQEARAFALLALLSATLLFLTCRLEQHFTWASVALWALCATLVLYTHLYGAFVVAACALYLLVAGYRHLLLCSVAVAAPVGLYIPWLQAALAHNDVAQNWRAPLSALQLVSRALGAVVHNGTLTSRLPALGVVGIAVSLAIVGLVSHGRRAASLLGLGVVLPLALSYFLSLRQPIFAERYIIVVAIPFYIAVALGVDALARRFRGAEIVTGVAALALCVHGVWAYSTPRFAKENYRAAAARIAQSTTAEDVILFVAEYVQHPFRYYYPGPARLVGFTGDPQNPGPFVEGVIRGARAVWLVEAHAEAVDPEHRVRQWLADRYPLATEVYPQGVQVRAYTIRNQLLAPPATARPVGISAGPLLLAAVEFPPSSPAQDNVLHPPSAWLPVTFYWQAMEQVGTDYQLVVQLVDERGVWGSSLEREHDLFHKLPTSRWSAGCMMVETVDVNLNPVTPPGIFRLQAQIQDATGRPLPVLDANGQPLGEVIPLGTVEIRNTTPPWRKALDWLSGCPRILSEALRRFIR